MIALVSSERGASTSSIHYVELLQNDAGHHFQAGDRLAFGSTTVGPWVSDNGGDNWQEITARLPPLYCVRFVAGR